MKVRVKFLARYRELSGKAEMELELEEGTTLARLEEEIIERYPHLKGTFHSVLAAVNDEYAIPELILHNGDEVAFLPPLSGG